jgi:serine/threonine protein kinase
MVDAKKPKEELKGEPLDNGLVRWKPTGSQFDLPPQYEVLDVIGAGAYGVVVAAKDKGLDGSGDEYIAIKKMEKVFEHKIFAQRTLRELKIMRLLNHDNVLSIKNILDPGSIDKFNELYVMSEMMETDLA